MSEGDDGIDAGGAEGGVDAGQEADEDRKGNRAQTKPPGEGEITHGGYALLGRNAVDDKIYHLAHDPP